MAILYNKPYTPCMFGIASCEGQLCPVLIVTVGGRLRENICCRHTLGPKAD